MRYLKCFDFFILFSREKDIVVTYHKRNIIKTGLYKRFSRTAVQVGYADGNGGEVCQRIISKDTRIRKHHKASYILWVVGGWVVGGGRGEKSVSLNLLRSSRLHLLVPKG